MPTRCPVLHIITFSFTAFQQDSIILLLGIIKLRLMLTKDNLLKVVFWFLGCFFFRQLDSKADMSNSIPKPLKHSKPIFQKVQNTKASVR